eukprot:CAMPEP_0195297044 /NCGR_PEP_ID=MMETSP0707-20130614/20707_1 /TAXON_ID=33640 /ORGANISM="Asterionellopsis glacialis, Strain CCMP134" /LENGTH=415 /DNA_ID=CAMNT_0040358731 /DNA_START=1 /DNA_END=1248 /DNA_ORIENTATION=-
MIFSSVSAIPSLSLFLSFPAPSNAANDPLGDESLPASPYVNLPQRQNYQYSKDWTGTSLILKSPSEAASMAWEASRIDNPSNSKNGVLTFPFAQWPDPILRRPASPIPPNFSRDDLRKVAQLLRKTARKEGAVGLAAQQCGIDASLIFLDTTPPTNKRLWNSKRKNTNDDENDQDSDQDGIFLVNPRIVERSSEREMKVWTEECLVLPPTFRATVLRDKSVTVEYERLQDGKLSQITLDGELARAAQHEMDHDRGILILDHVGYDEMENDQMRMLEKDGHDTRQFLAFERYLSTPSESWSTVMKTATATTTRKTSLLFRPAAAYAAEPNDSALGTTQQQSANRSNDKEQSQPQQQECDEECLAKRRKLIEERRAMMRQSRTTTNRQDMFELSKQRAKLYGTTYQGASCPPGVPCI